MRTPSFMAIYELPTAPSLNSILLAPARAPGKEWFPNDINPSRAIAGWYADAGNVNHGFVRAPDGGFTRLDVPGAFTCCAPVAIGGFYRASIHREAPPITISGMWRAQGVWTRLQWALHKRVRMAAGRAECPTVVIMEGQSAKTTERGGTRGFDGHKRVKGRKRHILVDTLGLPIASRVEPANISDRKAGHRLLGGLRFAFPNIRRPSSLMPAMRVKSSPNNCGSTTATNCGSSNRSTEGSRLLG
jgi:transposase